MPRPKQTRSVARARQLRQQMSLPEVLLWQRLQRSPDGVKFRRQHGVAGYILDFYCTSARVAFEVDGIAHDMGDRPARDMERDAALEELGIDVVRIPAREVLRAPDEVAEAILRACRK